MLPWSSLSSSHLEKKNQSGYCQPRFIPCLLLMGIVVLVFGSINTATILQLAVNSSNSSNNNDVDLLGTPILTKPIAKKDGSPAFIIAPPPTPPALPCIIYVRIPKTGSSSLVSDMLEWLGPRKISKGENCLLNNGEKGLLKYKKTVSSLARQVYKGHCGYGFDKYICVPPRRRPPREAFAASSAASSNTNTSCYYYTWLREPVSRVISSIIYNHRGNLPTNLSRLEHCLRPDVYCKEEKGPNWHNSMTYMLGSPVHEIYQPNRTIHVTRQHLELAKYRLEHNFVAFGLLEQAPESVRVLRSLLQLPPLLVQATEYGNIPTSNTTALVKSLQRGLKVKIGVANETKNQTMDSFQSLSHYNAANRNSTLFKERLSLELGTAIRQANLLDLELYEFAKQLFQERLLQTNTSASTRPSVWDSSSVQIQTCLPKQTSI
jgi:hypothetical protein